MDDVAQDRMKVGEHEFEFIAPDHLRFRFCGELTDADCATYLDFLFQYKNVQGGRLYSIYDLTKLTRVAEGARRRVVNVPAPYPYVGMAVMTANFSTRALVAMVMRAGRIIAPERLSFAYKFVSSVDEANAWFDELRSRRI